MKTEASAKSSLEHNIIKEADRNIIRMTPKLYKAKMVVEDDDESGYVASDMEEGIVTEGDTIEEIVNNIKEAVECHFNVPYDQVDVEIIYPN